MMAAQIVRDQLTKSQVSGFWKCRRHGEMGFKRQVEGIFLHFFAKLFWNLPVGASEGYMVPEKGFTLLITSTPKASKGVIVLSS